jgi:hypothetical protein
MEGPPKDGTPKEIQGWKLLGFGIRLEVVLAMFFAAREGWVAHNIVIEQAKNNPLNQPVSDVSAVLRFIIDAKNFDPDKPMSLDDTYLNTGPFLMRAKKAAWYSHVDNYASNHVSYYGIAIRFEQEILPSSEWNDINTTNADPFVLTDITVTNAISSSSELSAYVGFLSTNNTVVRGSARILVNGFRKDFQAGSNCVNRQLSVWNPQNPGIYINMGGNIK